LRTADEYVAEVKRAAELAAQSLDRRDRAIAAGYQAGAPLSRLADAAGLTVEGVRRIVQRAGVELRPPGRPSGDG
jgi:hypothetical protein